MLRVMQEDMDVVLLWVPHTQLLKPDWEEIDRVATWTALGSYC